MKKLGVWFGSCDKCGKPRKLIFNKEADVKICEKCDTELKIKVGLISEKAKR